MSDLATADAGRQAIFTTLQRVWGYDQLRPIQEEAIGDVLAARDSLVVMPTGGGKSLCYQLPALIRSGLAVVVSPLISLMKDQVDSLRSNGVAAAVVNSTQSDDEKREVARQIEQRELRLLYLAPERLLTEKTLRFLEKADISFFAIDEAHCVSSWGHDFRPEYRGLRVLKERFPNASVHAFTATASEPVRQDIVQQLTLREPQIHVGDFDRPNLTYRMMPSAGKLEQILSVVGRHPGASGIVYCISRREVEQTADQLVARGVSALPYHAGLDDETRRDHQEAFIQERVDVIVATVAFGMGIDKPNVRFVVHAGMPKSIEHYQQESGRAGRDGLAAECVLIYSGGDVITWQRILENGDSSHLEVAMQNVRAMANLCQGLQCRRAAILDYFGQEYDATCCNACDVCLQELDLVEDPLTLAQKILSCVVRVRERFGAAHVVKVLTGSRDRRVIELGHDSLSTHGLLSDERAREVRNWIQQLISQSFLERTGEFQILKLTATGRELLRGRGAVSLTRPAAPAGRRNKTSPSSGEWDGVDRELFEALRGLRRQLAAERSVPAYVIFGDAVLRDLARVRPSDLAKLGQLRGVGDRKLEEFGEVFLQRLDQVCLERQLERDVTGQLALEGSATCEGGEGLGGRDGSARVRTERVPSEAMREASRRFAAGESIADVAEAIGRAKSTVSGYLGDYLRKKQVTDPSPWVDSDAIAPIEQALSADTSGRLKPVYESLEGRFSYDAIRIVAVCLQNRSS